MNRRLASVVSRKYLVILSRAKNLITAVRSFTYVQDDSKNLCQLHLGHYTSVVSRKYVYKLGRVEGVSWRGRGLFEPTFKPSQEATGNPGPEPTGEMITASSAGPGERPRESSEFVNGLMGHNTSAMFALLLALWGAALGSSCNHPVVYGNEMQSETLAKEYKGSTAGVFEAARRALTEEGYKLLEDQPDHGILETGWVPSKAASHYVDLFDRKDYATVGSYYKLHVEVVPQEDRQRVEIRSIVKSTISNLKSSGSEENRIFSRISDLLRSASIEITNVGMTEK